MGGRRQLSFEEAKIVERSKKGDTLMAVKRISVVFANNTIERSINDGKNENHISHDLVMNKHEAICVNRGRVLKIKKHKYRKKTVKG